ncbi:MAG TPA: alpha/beta hydrolase, partial [Acidimicrobiia bacterium]
MNDGNENHGASRPAAAPRADGWRARGAHFSWQPPGTDAAPVDVFHVEAGDPEAPVLLLVHGFPTSSVDWIDVAAGLEGRFRVCALDFPGYGFSDKPRGWGYSLTRDAELLEHYLDHVVGAETAVVVAHDRGASVALLFALQWAERRPETALPHLVLSNGNIYLPLSNLTDFQRLVLDPATAERVLAATTPELLADGLGANTFTPSRRSPDPEIDALAVTFAHDDGVKVLHETIQYLVERSQNEAAWLERLAVSSMPTTIVWGLDDTVSPPRVAAHVWDRFLMTKPGRNALYFLPGANHYLQVDRPDAFVATVLHALDASAEAPGPISAEPGAPLLVDLSRAELPTAAAVLAN